MATWILVPSLVALRSDFNELAPTRDKATDGSIGDEAHSQNVSDHNPDETGSVPIEDSDTINEVHAIDVDKTGPWPWAGGMEAAVQHILKRCRAGQETRLRYIIYDRRIWSASNGWRQESYSGSNPHTEHAHFSASYVTAREADTSTWHLEDLVALTDAEIEKIATRVEQRVWNHTEPNPYDDGATNRRMGGDLRMMEFRDDERARATNIHRLDNQVIPMVTQTLALVQSFAGRDLVDEPAIASAVLAGLKERPVQETADLIVAILGQESATEVARVVLGQHE